MRYACIVGAGMIGNVPHHSGHIIGWTGEEYPQPIYCNGHSVSGTADTAGESSMFIQGINVLVEGASGPSNDECDNSRFYCTNGSKFMFINGKPIILTDDSIDLYPGEGKMINANQSKFIILLSEAIPINQILIISERSDSFSSIAPAQRGSNIKLSCDP